MHVACRLSLADADCRLPTSDWQPPPTATADSACRLPLVPGRLCVKCQTHGCRLPPHRHCSGTLRRQSHSTGSWPIQPWATARHRVSCSCLSSLQMYYLKFNEAFVVMFVNVAGSVGRLCGLGSVCLQLARHNKSAKLFTIVHFRTASVIHCALSTQGCSEL